MSSKGGTYQGAAPFFVEFLFQPFRITGRCLTFFPICRRSSAKTISGVRSKNPMPFFPAHPAAAVLQADKLLLHLPPAVWTDFVACTHASPCTSVKRMNDKLEFVSIKVSESHLQFHERFYCLYQFLRYQVPDTYESFRRFCQ